MLRETSYACTFSPMSTAPATATTCPTCAALRGLIQCNKCRSERPDAQTLIRREALRLVREDGLTAAQAEARLGVKAGRSI